MVNAGCSLGLSQQVSYSVTYFIIVLIDLILVCRAIGIPSRVVSNLVSAHDTNATLTVDKYFDANNEELKEFNEDSIWNYHVWNDVYMARPDLPPGDYLKTNKEET